MALVRLNLHFNTYTQACRTIMWQVLNLIWFSAVDLYSYIAAARMCYVYILRRYKLLFFLWNVVSHKFPRILCKHITKVFLSICWRYMCVSLLFFFFIWIWVPANIVIKCIARANAVLLCSSTVPCQSICGVFEYT